MNEYIAEIRQLRNERDALSDDLRALRDAVRVRPSQKAMKIIRETLEAMEAMDDEGGPALRLLIEMYDKIGAIL